MTALLFGTEHLYSRPHWDCRACAVSWPCANAKAGLLEEFRAFPSVLTIYMSAQMHQALSDLTSHGEAAPPDLYERFLSWTRHPAPAANVTQSTTAKRNVRRTDGTGTSPVRRRISKHRQTK
jgi:hypothetical protein